MYRYYSSFNIMSSEQGLAKEGRQNETGLAVETRPVENED